MIAPTLSPFCPATPTLVGGSSGRTSIPLPSRGLVQRLDAGIFFKLHPHRKTVPVKHGRLDHAHRRHRDRVQAPAATPRCFSTRCSIPSSGSSRLLAVTGQHREGELRVEHVGLEFLEREHRDVLLLQFVKTFLPALAGRFEHMNDGPPQRRAFGKRVKNIAMAMAAGCAITWTAPRFFTGAFSAKGARRRAFGCSSRAEVRSTSTVFFGRDFQRLAAGRGRSGEESHARAFETGCGAEGPSPQALRHFRRHGTRGSRRCPEISSTRGAGLVSASTSRSSRASSVSPPTTATRGRTRKGSANLMLRFGRRGFHSAPATSADANYNAAQHVGDGHRRAAPAARNARREKSPLPEE